MATNRVGAIGGGQLAWMLGMEAPKLGIELFVQTPQPEDPAVFFATDTVLAPIDDAAATAKLAELCQVVTFENEFVDLQALWPLEEKGVCFRPSLRALSPLLDKYEQRCFLKEAGVPIPAFALLEREEDATEFSFPAAIKARRGGYDGRGTEIVADADALKCVWSRWQRPSALVEAYVPFVKELAVMAARSPQGEIALHPIVGTEQEAQVCRRVFAPAAINKTLEKQIERIVRTVLERLQAIGIFGFEFFLTADDRVWVNEIAPRPHNSGHFTLDACHTSQFEQHLRAVSDRPLGNPSLACDGAVMVNLLGYEHRRDNYAEKREKLAAFPNARVYWYGKQEARPGRKLGHVTVLLAGHAPNSLQREAQEAARAIETIWHTP